MKSFRRYCGLLATLMLCTAPGFSQSASKGVFLEDINWIEAARVLTPEAIVVIPLGAQSKEHGPHLPLSADYIQSAFFAKEIAKTENVIIAPQMNYGYYFPFIAFPGSTTLRHSVAKNMVLDICRSLSAFGPKRFYIINEGIATNAALSPAAESLAQEGILLYYTDLNGANVHLLVKGIQTQKEGSHADEIETSKVLYMQPAKVNMKLAKQEYGVRRGKGFPTYDSTQTGHYIPSGIYGDATLATKEKGKRVTEGMLSIMREDIDRLRKASLPQEIKHDLTPFVGTYETGDQKRIVMTDDGGLVCEFNAFPKEKLHFDGENYFSGFYYEAWFKVNDAGGVSNVRLIDFTGTIHTAKKVK